VTESPIDPEDIVFDCPYCDKSLAIDPRGAGMHITCPDCGRSVEVPDPSLQETDEDAAATKHDEGKNSEEIQELRDALSASEKRVQELTESVKEVYGRRNFLEEMRADNLKRFESIGKELGIIQDAVDRIMDALQNVKKTQNGKT
jgi:septal ring factor EnvC (AmiA/AmiB activator)